LLLADDFQSLALAVGHEEQPLSLVRSADACSWQICRCAGVSRSFQVSEYSVEPPEASSTRNLLAKEDCRSALADETEPDRPEMTGVGGSGAAAGTTERLARARAGPDIGVVSDASESERGGPSTDASKKVPLSRPSNVSWSQLRDASFIDNSWCDMPRRNHSAQPARRKGFVFVVRRDWHAHRHVQPAGP